MSDSSITLHGRYDEGNHETYLISVNLILFLESPWQTVTSLTVRLYSFELISACLSACLPATWILDLCLPLCNLTMIVRLVACWFFPEMMKCIISSIFWLFIYHPVSLFLLPPYFFFSCYVSLYLFPSLFHSYPYSQVAEGASILGGFGFEGYSIGDPQNCLFVEIIWFTVCLSKYFDSLFVCRNNLIHCLFVCRNNLIHCLFVKIIWFTVYLFVKIIWFTVCSSK